MLKVEQIYTGCLAQGAYYIQSGGEAVVIDPLRDSNPYLLKAEKNNATIKYVLETHFHADFVSGHIDLAQKTGALIVFGENAQPQYPAHIAKDGEELTFGNTKIKVLHTPGHTMESVCYLLYDEQGKEYALFTGDTLFIGDVGRPDLAAKSALTQEDLAGFLYQSVQKIKQLPDDILIYPAHGAGSACGKNMSKETFDTLSNQKKVNYALQEISKEQFVKEVTDGLQAPPYYFPENVKINTQGYESLDVVIERAMKGLSPNEFEDIAARIGAIVLDTRKPDDFVNAFIPNAISIGINGDFAPWVGTLITDIHQPLLLLTDPDKLEESITRLSRVGYDHIVGYLKGGIEAWKSAGKDIDTIESISATELEERLVGQRNYAIIDVRKESEYAASHLMEASLAPLAQLNAYMSVFEDSKTNFIHCAGGYRSVIAASILKARGISNIVNISGGYKTIEQTSLPKT